MKYILTIIAFITFLTACNHKQAEPAGKADHQEEAPGNIAAITPRQLKAAGIETDTIALKNLTTAIKATGMLTVPNQNKALVTSIISGVIKTLLVQPGDFVKKGQTLATIINPEVATLQQELQITNAQIRLAEIEQRRQKELVEGNAAPLKNLQHVETELATLRATRNALQQQLHTMGISLSAVASGEVVTTLQVKAPISGTISEISAEIGSNIDPSTPIAHIVNNSQLHLDLFVYEKDLPQLKRHQTIHFTLTNNAGKEYDARIYSIGTAFASDSKTIPVHAVVKGDKTGLIEGMNITAVISIGKAVVPAVPADAIVSSGGQDYIFIVTQKPPATPEEKKASEEQMKEQNGESTVQNATYFQKMPVMKGTTDIGFTEIIPVNPIPAGTKIVVKGAFFVMAKLINTGGHED